MDNADHEAGSHDIVGEGLWWGVGWGGAPDAVGAPQASLVQQPLPRG